MTKPNTRSGSEPKDAPKKATIRSTVLPTTSTANKLTSKTNSVSQKQDKPQKLKQKSKETVNDNESIDKRIANYFEEDDSMSEYEESDASNTSTMSSKEQAIAIINNDEVLKLKNELLELRDSDENKFRSKSIEKAMRAISYIKVIEKRTTRLPQLVCKEIDRALEIISNSLLDLENKATFATAQVEILQNMQTTTQNNQSNNDTQNQTKQTVNVANNIAKQINNASATLIIQDQNRASEEVEKQIINEEMHGNENIRKVNRIRNGIAIQCNSAEVANELKTKIESENKNSEDINVKIGTIKKKKVIIFKVSKWFTDENIIKGIASQLGITNETAKGKLIEITNKKLNANDLYTITITAVEAVANELVKRKRITIGYKDSPVRPFIHITRCFRCQGLDHVATECGGRERCSRCNGEHNYKDCRSKHECCGACSQYNDRNRGHLRAPLNTAHSSVSSSCWIYNTLMSIRTIESEQGKKVFTTGNQVVRGEVSIQTYQGKKRIVKPQTYYNKDSHGSGYFPRRR